MSGYATHELREAESESMTLIESKQGQKASVAADMPAAKIHLDAFGTVEREIKLWYTRCHFHGCSERECWVRQNPVFINLLENPFFFHQKNRE